MKQQFKIDINRFIENEINTHVIGAEHEIVLSRYDIFDLFYGDEKFFGEFIQNETCDTDLLDLFCNFTFVRVKDNHDDTAMPDFILNVDQFKAGDRGIEVGPYELMISLDELIDWVDAHPMLQRCYKMKTDWGFFPLDTRAEPDSSLAGVDSQEGSEKMVSEENKPISVNEVTKEPPLEFETAAAWCLNVSVFKDAMMEFGIYWAGQANPHYQCASIMDLAQAIIDEINQRIHLYVAGEENEIKEFYADDELGPEGKRWKAMIQQTLGTQKWDRYVMDEFGVKLVNWAILHKFYMVNHVCGLESRDLDGEMLSTEEWRDDEFWSIACQNWGVSWAIEACRDVNADQHTLLSYVDGELSVAYFQLEQSKDKAFPDAVQAIDVVKKYGQNIEPIFTWIYSGY